MEARIEELLAQAEKNQENGQIAQEGAEAKVEEKPEGSS